jgi:hypothetical protein
MFVICLDTKLNMAGSNGSLIIAITSEAKENVRMVATLLF